jgi:serine/threonine protein kinase
LIATAGPWFAILGLVFTDCVIIQRLTDFIWVGLDSVLNETRIKKVARIFYALRTSLEKLRYYYENLKPIANTPAPSRYFPSFTTYSYKDELVHFEYVGFLEDGPDCITLRARTCAYPAPSQDVVVKFVDHYGERAHCLLAENGLAPTLFYYGSPCLDKEPSYHSLSMVVMDYVDGDTLASTKKEKSLNEKTTQIVRSEVQRAIGILHLHGLVFGDLRSPNVMITNAKKVKLIDFNWAGVEGQARYPSLISSDIEWAAGVEALGVIKKDHDMEMLDRLFP